MSPLILIIVVFVGVASLVGGVAVLIRGSSDGKVEDRLDALTRLKKLDPRMEGAIGEGVLSEPLDDTPGVFDEFFERFGNLTLLFEQADTSLTVTRFVAISAGVGAGGFVVALVLGMGLLVAPVLGAMTAALPLMWVLFRRKRRLAKFGQQLSDALELIARALRSGHSLAAAMELVATEMSEPISTEFSQVYEEQNLGVTIDDALDGMTHRVPNLDLKFFATAVILQRQTGGDLAEILDKIGELIRERYKILGQVQALTGEGRLSGIVLLALPPVLFLAVYRLNPEYASVLFTDPMGKKMLAGAGLSMLLGALVIRKIVDIKV
ncbi:MAG: type II secretion system F family protein [Planctomycetes bacterium]|nr:type II secretion system F family protein [Planctomycetota bacterium]